MVRTKDELLERARNIIGERTDDDALGFVEDLTDSYTANEDWHAKYMQLDADWRAKYKERFFSGTTDNSPTDLIEETEQEPKKISYSDLFTTN